MLKFLKALFNFLFGWLIKPVPAPDTPPASEPDPPTAPPEEIAIGSTNVSLVKQLQTLLNGLGWSLTIDGDFGPITEELLMEFQNTNGLPHTLGICDAATWFILKSPTAKKAPYPLAGFLAFLHSRVGSPYVLGGRNALIQSESDINRTNCPYEPHLDSVIAYYRKRVAATGIKAYRVEDCGSLADTYLIAHNFLPEYTDAKGTFEVCDTTIPLNKAVAGCFVCVAVPDGIQHIGYVVDSEGTVIESANQVVGCIVSNMKSPGARWNRCGIPRCFEEEIKLGGV